MSIHPQPLSKPSPPDNERQDRHHWSGWPGAHCLKCGVDDHREQALADGDITFVETPGNHPEDEPSMDLVYRSKEVEERLAGMDTCPVHGILVWNKAEGVWELHSDGKPADMSKARPADGRTG